jgi:lipid A 3-O-deacylase PagL
MMITRRLQTYCISAVLLLTARVCSGQPVTKTSVPLGKALDHALEHSALIGANARPFDLKVHLFESTNPPSPYRTEIEEYWVSPQWRGSIDTPEFKQMLRVNGDQKNTGDYYPSSLKGFITGIFDPLPNADQRNMLDAKITQTTLPTGQRSDAYAALSAFPRSGAVSIDRANQPGEETIRLVREKQILAVPTFTPFEYFADHAARPTPWDGSFSASERLPEPDESLDEAPATLGNMPGGASKNSASFERVQPSKPADLNQQIYYRNKLEFSLDGGWLPVNIPFPLDVFVGDAYNTYPLKYTLVPIFASLRWHMGGLWGPSVLRGNFDFTFTGSVTGVARGPESRYFAYLMGIRRNFVPRRSRVAPYFDVRLGVGNIDAKGPKGVLYAQGQDLTFTINMGSGVRYNFSPRYAISAGLNYMHISNLDLSESNGKPNWGITNYGINVYGPMVGIDIQLRRHLRRSE